MFKLRKKILKLRDICNEQECELIELRKGIPKYDTSALESKIKTLREKFQSEVQLKLSLQDEL